MSGSLGDVRIDSLHGSEAAESDTTATDSLDAPPPSEGTDSEERSSRGEGDAAGSASADTAPAEGTGGLAHTDEDSSAAEVRGEREASAGRSAWNDGLIARRAKPVSTADEPMSAEAEERPAEMASEAASEAASESAPAVGGEQRPEAMGAPLVDVAVFDALPSLATPRPVTVPVTAGPEATFAPAVTSELPTAAGTGTGSFPAPQAETAGNPSDALALLDTGDVPGVSVTSGAVGQDVTPPSEAGQELAGSLRGDAPRPQASVLAPEAPPSPRPSAPPAFPPGVPSSAPSGERGLGKRLVALRELVGLSRTRLDPRTLAEAVRVLEEAAARGRLSRAHTTVAIAGSTGCGKSTLFNALAGAQLSEAGVRRPTTAAPVACVWETTERDGGADGLLERLGVPPRSRRRAHLRDSGHRGLGGLVLLDLPDHDSMAEGHREQVDRVLRLVDAVVWVVDPEKYADAVLHERYLRPLAGHAEITYVVLNQTDRLPADVTGELLDDLRRLLDDDGVALGEHGDPGAQVLSLSALTGEGVGELRDSLRELVGERAAAARRLAADVGKVVRELRPACVAEGNERPEGLTASVRENFEERLGVAVGAAAVGRTAERVWTRQADLACGTAWASLARLQVRRAAAKRGERPEGWAVEEQSRSDVTATKDVQEPASTTDADKGSARQEAGRSGRAVVEQAVRGLVDDATRGLPKEWARAAKKAALRGSEGLPAALDQSVATARLPVRPTRPTWWTVAAAGQALLLALQFIGVCWLVGGILAGGMGPERWVPFGLLVGGALGAPLLAWACRVAARGPARAFGLDQELRLRRLAADSGRARVLEPVAAELLRYTEVREQYVIAAAGPQEV